MRSSGSQHQVEWYGLGEERREGERGNGERGMGRGEGGEGRGEGGEGRGEGGEGRGKREGGERERGRGGEGRGKGEGERGGGRESGMEAQTVEHTLYVHNRLFSCVNQAVQAFLHCDNI